MKAIQQTQTNSADLIASCVLALEMKQKQKQQSSYSAGSRDVDACMDGGGANTDAAQRWVNRACWMGRQWIPTASSTQQINQHQHHPHHYLGGTSTSDGDGSSSMPGFRLISYNVLSDFKNAYQSHSTVKNWDTRRQLLLGEMLSYSPDVICLQDADHYQDWWRPQLTNRGIFVCMYIYMSPHRSWVCGVYSAHHNHYHHHHACAYCVL